MLTTPLSLEHNYIEKNKDPVYVGLFKKGLLYTILQMEGLHSGCEVWHYKQKSIPYLTYISPETNPKWVFMLMSSEQVGNYYEI